MQILTIEDVATAIDRGWEKLADIQYTISARSRISGDVDQFNRMHVDSMKLYANIIALQEVPFNHDIYKNKVVELLYNKIKLQTKNFNRWD